MPKDTIPADAGMNRLVWDLRMSDPAQIPGAFYSGEAPRGPIVAPGIYQVKLTVNGASQTAPLTVVIDPRTAGGEAAVQAKTALSVQVTADIDALHKAVNAVRAAEKQCVALKPQLAGIEQALMQVNMKGSEANLAFPGMMNEQYATFQSTLEDADTPLTVQHQAMYDELHRRLTAELGDVAAGAGAV